MGVRMEWNELGRVRGLFRGLFRDQGWAGAWA